MKREGIQYGAPKASGWSSDFIDKFGTDVATALGFEPKNPLVDVVKRLGGRLEYVSNWEFYDNESIFVHSPQDFDIYVSQYTSPLRDRFTIAHELAHYVLHSNFGKIPLVAKRIGSNLAEREANWFAAGFLMPRDLMCNVYKQCGGELWKMAAQLGLSESAVTVRVEYLQRIGVIEK